MSHDLDGDIILMSYKHLAILELYPHVKRITEFDSANDLEIVDSDENPVTIDIVAVDVKTAEITTKRNLYWLRDKRNKLLAETDWWELPTHSPMSAERTAYRQALRDITDTYTSLDDVVWPTKPE